MQTLRICKRCLLKDMEDEQALYGLIQSRIALLSESEKAADQEYRHRLSICGDCGELHHGACAQCGCYVELRAARRTARCPLPIPKW
jgi:hypothetical protein